MGEETLTATAARYLAAMIGWPLAIVIVTFVGALLIAVAAWVSWMISGWLLTMMPLGRLVVALLVLVVITD